MDRPTAEIECLQDETYNQCQCGSCRMKRAVLTWIEFLETKVGTTSATCPEFVADGPGRCRVMMDEGEFDFCAHQGPCSRKRQQPSSTTNAGCADGSQV